MAEKLTKTALKDELTRRINWFEKSYGFTEETSNQCIKDRNKLLHVAYGRYRALIEMRWQIQEGLFIDGFAS